MNGLYWLVPLLIIAAVIGVYARYWYYRPSGMSEILSASYSHQTLEYMDSSARRKGEDSESYEFSTYEIASHLKSRKLDWRQRNDIVSYMTRLGWVHEFPEQGTKYYAISRAGKHELETADGLGQVVKEAAQTLHDKGISGDQAKATAAEVVAAALRVQARSASSENRKRAEASANEIEKALRTRDPGEIDRTLTRIRDTLQIVTYSVPFVRDILRILGLL